MDVQHSRTFNMDRFCFYMYQLKTDISETGSLADSDICGLDYANVEAHSQVIEVSLLQGPVEATSAIDVCQAPTMDNLVPVPQCAMLLTCTHAPPLGSTFSPRLLAHSTSATAPLLVWGLASRQEL